MTTIPPWGIDSPYENNFRYNHDNPNLRVTYVAYRNAPYLTWFGGLVSSCPHNSTSLPLTNSQVTWNVINGATCRPVSPKPDSKVIRINREWFVYLRQQEARCWWTEYHRYYAGIESRVFDQFASAGYSSLPLPRHIIDMMKSAAERAAHRNIVRQEHDEFMVHDWVHNHNGHPVIKTHCDDLPSRYRDVDDFVEVYLDDMRARRFQVVFFGDNDTDDDYDDRRFGTAIAGTLRVRRGYATRYRHHHYQQRANEDDEGLYD